mmetsp:Transcript_57401/g.145567  ORF Transcript_57401/g.145567 Transcript_57401/m.145567 type:complete len:260 (+) Transcript_57401:26-805(+)
MGEPRKTCHELCANAVRATDSSLRNAADSSKRGNTITLAQDQGKYRMNIAILKPILAEDALARGLQVPLELLEPGQKQGSLRLQLPHLRGLLLCSGAMSAQLQAELVLLNVLRRSAPGRMQLRTKLVLVACIVFATGPDSVSSVAEQPWHQSVKGSRWRSELPTLALLHELEGRPERAGGLAADVAWAASRQLPAADLPSDVEEQACTPRLPQAKAQRLAREAREPTTTLEGQCLATVLHRHPLATHTLCCGKGRHGSR